MSGDIIDQAQNAFNGKPNSKNDKAKNKNLILIDKLFLIDIF